jgi:hypothetical protein
MGDDQPISFKEWLEETGEWKKLSGPQKVLVDYAANSPSVVVISNMAGRQTLLDLHDKWMARQENMLRDYKEIGRA